MWEFPGVEDLNQVINLVRDYQPIATEENWDDRPLTANIQQVDGFNINNPENLEIEGNQINYVIFECITERSRNPEFWYSTQGQL